MVLSSGVVALLLPAGDEVGAGLDAGDEVGDHGGVVLEVGVEGEDDLAAHALEAGGEGRGLAEVAAEVDDADARVLCDEGVEGLAPEPSRLPSSMKRIS
jgi:hypothetical protein